MTVEEFNTKYRAYLEKDYYGLAINNEKVIAYLNEIFEDLIKIPGFTFYQIKLKFKYCSFYVKGISWDLINSIENKINLIINE